MQYGYFNDAKREYVITDPRTPMAWANYLGSPEYGAIVTQNAGGYSFVKSGANGRILRYSFNQFDEPGRYVYLRDDETGDYWSASWRPVEKPLEAYKTITRHGTSYTEIESEYAGIKSETLYYVPMNATHEVWRVRVTNNSDKVRTISAMSYCELTTESNYEQDLVNLQYTQFITNTTFHGDCIVQHINQFCGVNEKGENWRERVFALAGAPVKSYCGRREKFTGPNRFRNPMAVEKGDLGNVLNFNGNPCGALHAQLVLQPGESKTIAFLLMQKAPSLAREVIDRYADTEKVVNAELAELIEYWHGKLSGLMVNTPDANFNTMINTWNAFQCFTTFVWSRAASLIYCGQRNGLGYRDTVQDIQGIIHLDPEMAKERLVFMLSAQVHHGGGLPLVKFNHNAGHEDKPEDESYVRSTGHPHYRADDALWLFPTVYKYICESGNLAFIDEVIPYANRDSGTVYDHLKRAIAFSMNRLGPHGLPAGLYADWNDCLRLGEQGESTFVAMQYFLAMTIAMRFAEYKKDTDYIAFLTEKQAALGKLLNELCWNEDRFIRGFTQAGETIGKPRDPEANMWLNPQSWSVISGLATPEQADTALNRVETQLNTRYGAVLMDPPYHAHAFEGALAVIYNAGVKENAGIFSQSQGWIILAEALRGHGDRAFQYFMENAPAAQNDRAEIRKLEPYCYGQFTEGKASPHFGRSHVHWLTGTASTVMVGCVEGILGMRPDFYGLRIAPAIPKAWDGFEIEKVFRGCKLHIMVKNPNHVESGFTQMKVNGKVMPDNYVPAELLTENTEIELTLS